MDTVFAAVRRLVLAKVKDIDTHIRLPDMPQAAVAVDILLYRDDPLADTPLAASGCSCSVFPGQANRQGQGC